MNDGLLRWHRRLGLIAAVGVILSSLSGMLHPLMTRLQPAPVKMMLDYRIPSLEFAWAPGALLAAHGIVAITDLRVVSWNGRTYYQITLPDGVSRSYFGLQDGAPLADGDRQYAEYLAREFIGESAAAVRSARIVRSFDWEYPRINRLLPVWRVEFDRADNMRAYVDTRTGRLGTLVDRAKGLSSVEFAILHRWQWLDSISPAARLVIFSLVLLAALSVALSGIWIYLWRWSQSAGRWNLRRVHRVWGIAISLVSFVFVLSGGYHLLHVGINGDSGERSPALPEPFPLVNLKVAPSEAVRLAAIAMVKSVSLARIDGRTYYQVQPAQVPRAAQSESKQPHDEHLPHGKATPSQVETPGTPVFISAMDGAILPDGVARFAVDTARGIVAGAVNGKINSVTQFDDEYGFAFKRLPVYRVPFAGNLTVYVDADDGNIAAVIDNADRAEAWVFSYIHKFEWLASIIGADWRDAIASLLAFSLTIAALLGIALYLQLFRFIERRVGKLSRK